jgi:ribonuclease BN (tRNA processing enzyme)
VVFLGTSSSMPTISRNTSCIALRLGMYPWAFVSMNFASSIFRILGLGGFFFFFFSALSSFFRFVFGGW